MKLTKKDKLELGISSIMGVIITLGFYLKWGTWCTPVILGIFGGLITYGITCNVVEK